MRWISNNNKEYNHHIKKYKMQ